MSKRTIQLEVWSDDDAKVADFVNATRLMAQAAFGADKQNIVFSSPGVRKVRASLDDVIWRSANVSGRMKLKD